MPSEAVNRDNNFRDALSYPSLVWDVLHYEYLMRTKLWKDAFFNGMQWTGIPGLRRIGLGNTRNLDLGGGLFYKMGKANTKLIGKAIEIGGMALNVPKMTAYGQKFITTGIGNNFLGNLLGGYRSELFSLQGVLPEHRVAVTKALETNWVSAIMGKMTPQREKALAKLAIPEIGNRKTALKYAFTRKIMPAAIWTGNVAFIASLTMPIFAAAGRAFAGGLDVLERFPERLNRRELDFGGKIHMSYMNGPGLTERQRALTELQKSRTNARTFIGGEAQLYHQ